MITLRYSVDFQCNLVHEQSLCLLLVALNKYMTCFFRFSTILAFLKNGILQITRLYWAVNLESLGLDTLSNTDTSKPCISSKHGLVIHKFNILLS